MRMSRPVIALAASALVLSLSGCFSNPVESLVEGVIENQTGVDVNAGTDGQSASLPDGWPGLPVPAGTITTAMSADNTYVITVLVDSTDDIEAVIAQLISQGYTETGRTDLGELAGAVLTSPEWTAGLTWIADADTNKFYLNYGVSATDG